MSYFSVLLFFKWETTLKSFPTIDNPVTFTKNYEPDSNLLYKHKIGGLEGRVINSPYFPYTQLTTRWVEERKCPKRYYSVDTFWNIIWVEIVNCGERTKFYGPFRWTHRTKNLPNQ